MSVGPHYYPTTSATTLTLTTGVSSDDAEMNNGANVSTRGDTANGLMSLTGFAGETPANSLTVGSHASGDARTAGFCFTSVTIAQGTTIISATLSLTPSATYTPAGGNHVSVNVGCQAADNAATFTTTSGNLNTTTRARTTAATTHDFTVCTAGTAHTIDITTAVQEVINRAGFASGNAIVVIADNNGATTTIGEWQDLYQFDVTGVTTAQKPTLVIVY